MISDGSATGPEMNPGKSLRVSRETVILAVVTHADPHHHCQRLRDLP